MPHARKHCICFEFIRSVYQCFGYRAIVSGNERQANEKREESNNYFKWIVNTSAAQQLKDFKENLSKKKQNKARVMKLKST